MIRAQILVALRAVTTFIFIAVSSSGAVASTSPIPAAIVRSILSVPDDRLDYRRAKLAFDRIIDPSVNVDATLAEIDRLARRASALAGSDAAPAAKLSALRRVIYESGPWNDSRPFAYDLADPLGLNIRNKLISTYLATRRGNCVSMPILCLIVGERMGLNLALDRAAPHLSSLFRGRRARDQSGGDQRRASGADLMVSPESADVGSGD